MYRREIAGIGRYLRELIWHLAEIDKKNDYVLFMTPKDAEEYVRDAKSQITNNKLQTNSKFQIPNLKFQIKITDIPHYSLAEQIKLPKIIEEQNLDLIHYPNFNHPIFCRVPFVATIHDLIYLHFPGRSMNSLLHKIMYWLMNRDIAKKARKIIAVSEHTKKDFLENFPCDLDKIEVIYEAAGRDPTSPTSLGNKIGDRAFGNHRGRISSTNHKYPVSDIQSPIFLYVGAWRPHKNLTFLIQAFAGVIREIPKAKLVIAGKVDPEFPEIPATVAKFNLQNNVLFTDFISDEKLEKLYSLATAFVFPSLYEGFGLPPLEAAARGVPVICSNRTSLPEVMGRAALYANPENCAEWGQAMVKVARDTKFANNLGKKGLEQVKKFSWKKTAQETLQAYREVAKGKKINRAIFSKTSIYV